MEVAGWSTRREPTDSQRVAQKVRCGKTAKNASREPRATLGRWSSWSGFPTSSLLLSEISVSSRVVGVAFLLAVAGAGTYFALRADPAVGPELMATLAIGGTDGTLRRRLKALADGRRVRAKTGTLNAVAALSGYLSHRTTGRTWAFSILVNDAKGRGVRMRRPIDAFVEALAREQAVP